MVDLQSLLNNLALPLLVTFLTYLVSQQLLKPVSRWRDLKDKLIVALVQYANYEAYSYVDKEGKRRLDDKGMINAVEQDLRKLAGEAAVLPDYKLYHLWKFWLLPNEKTLDDVRGDLIGWANSLIQKDGKYDPGRETRMESLKKHLGLPNYYSEMRQNWDRKASWLHKILYSQFSQNLL